MAKGIAGSGAGFDAPCMGRLGGRGPVPIHNPPSHQLKSLALKVGLHHILRSSTSTLSESDVVCTGGLFCQYPCQYADSFAVLNYSSAHAVHESHTASLVQLFKTLVANQDKMPTKQVLCVIFPQPDVRPARHELQVCTPKEQCSVVANLVYAQFHCTAVQLTCGRNLWSHVPAGCRSTLQEAGCHAQWSQKAWWRSQLAERLDASSGVVTCLSHLSCTAYHQQQQVHT